MSEPDVYRKFIDWLGKTWWELPDSEHLMPAIKARYTVKEAEFLTGFPFSGRSLEELAELKSMEPDQLRPYLDGLARKGVLFGRASDNTVRYSLNDAFFVFFRSAFWPGNDDEDSRQIAAHTNRYYFDGFYDQYATVHAKGLRALPIHAGFFPMKMWLTCWITLNIFQFRCVPAASASCWMTIHTPVKNPLAIACILTPWGGTA